MERRKKKLLEKLKELRETTQIASLKKEIEEAKVEQRRLSTRIFLLSWLGAGIQPSIFFIISFICAVFGINTEILSQNPEIQRFLAQQLVIYSASTLAIGLMILLLVIRAIDSAAKQFPIPEFEVYFENRAKVLKLKRNERRTIRLCIPNKGEDMAQNVQVFVNFPPMFKVQPMADYEVVKQTAETEYPDYNAAVFRIRLIHIDTIPSMDIDLTPPDEKKTYEIPIHIYERKTGVSKHKLAIEVVDQRNLLSVLITYLIS